jgi:polysaccharide biosynthesis transport protein
MEIRDYIAPLRKWWWLILAVTLIAGVVGFVIVEQQPETFQTTATLQIGQSILQDPNPTTSLIAISQQLALTYADLARRSAVRQATMDALGLDLLPTYTIRPVASTQLMEITVTDTSPERAQAVANELANQLILQSPTASEQEERERQAFIDRQLDDLEQEITNTQATIQEKQQELSGLFSARQISELQDEIREMQSALNTLQSNYAGLLANSKRGAINTLSLVEAAALPSAPIGPQILTYTLLTAVIGLVLCGSAVFLFEYLDDSVRNPDDVSKVTGLPTLAGIARIKSEDEYGRLITIEHPRSPISEAYRVLRTGIQFSSIDNPEQVKLLITSANPSEGKSLTAANLAVVMAQAGRNVLIIDADLRKPRQHQIFNLNKNQGLTNLLLEYNLTDRSDASLALVKRFIQPTQIPGLHVLCSGPIPPNPSELLGSAKMRALLPLLTSQFDVVILDSPPALAVTDSVLLSARVDGVLLVAQAGSTKRSHLQQVTDRLQEANAHVAGVVLNRLSPRGGGYYYYYYRSAYYQEEGDTTGKAKSTANGNGNGRSRVRRRKQEAMDES